MTPPNAERSPETDSTSHVVENQEQRRFELRDDGEVTSFADYHLRGDVVVVPHVETPVAYRGQGNAGKLMAGMLDLLETSGRKIEPLCPYAAKYLKEHPDRQSLAATDGRE